MKERTQEVIAVSLVVLIVFNAVMSVVNTVKISHLDGEIGRTSPKDVYGRLDNHDLDVKDILSAIREEIQTDRFRGTQMRVWRDGLQNEFPEKEIPEVP